MARKPASLEKKVIAEGDFLVTALDF